MRSLTNIRAIKIIDNVIRYTEGANMPILTPLRDVLVKVHYAGICRTDIGISNGTISHKDSIIWDMNSAELLMNFTIAKQSLSTGEKVWL